MCGSLDCGSLGRGSFWCNMCGCGSLGCFSLCMCFSLVLYGILGWGREVVGKMDPFVTTRLADAAILVAFIVSFVFSLGSLFCDFLGLPVCVQN